MRKFYILCVIVTVLVARHTLAEVDSLGCITYETSLPPPYNLTVQVLSTHNVAMSVMLANGYYDWVNVYIYVRGKEVSSGAANVSRTTVGQENLRVNLSEPLTVGQTYDVIARTRTGSVCSSPGRGVQATVGGIVPTTQAPQLTISSKLVVPQPTLTHADEAFGGIQVTWTTVSDQLDKIIVTAQPSEGEAVTVVELVKVFGNQPRSSTIAALRLTKGQTYNVSLKAEYNGVQSLSSLSRTITLTPSQPVSLSVTPSSGDQTIAVRWRSGGGVVSRFYVRIYDRMDWSKEDEVPFQTATYPYHHVFNPPKSGEYNIQLKSQSGLLNSSFVGQYGVRLASPPVNISVQSKTSRSIELSWQRTDNNVNRYRMVVHWNQSCVQTVYFADKDFLPQYPSPCVQRREVFNVSSADITYNITGLLPYTEYQINLYVTFVDWSEPSRLNVMTDVEVPSKVSSVRLTAKSTRNVSVCWNRPMPYPGPTNYTMTLVDLGKEPRPDREQVIAAPPLGYSSSTSPVCGTFADLEEYWPYKIRLLPLTKAGDGPSSETEEFRTLEAAPGRVTNLEFTVPDGLITFVKVTWGPPKPRYRNANITSFTLKYWNKVSDNVTSFTIPWSQTDLEVYSKVVEVEPGEVYNFSLVAVSKTFMGEALYAEYSAPRGPPPVPTGCVICPRDSTKGPAPQSSHTFEVNLRTGFFSDDTNGEIVDSGLIVIQTSFITADSSPKMFADAKNANWQIANSKDFAIPYRATPVDWYIQVSRSERDADFFQYTVGKDENCSESVETFCNGPLKPSTKYSVKIFSCTHGGCTETEYKHGYETSSDVNQSDEAVVAAVSASCVVVFVIIVVVVVVLFMRFRRRKNKERSSDDSDGAIPFTSLVKEPDDDIQTSNPIPLAELFQSVEELHADSNLAFSRQFLWLKERSPNLPATAAVLPDNMLKNRYVDILPFDDTRVKLLPVEDDETSDYINANYIPGYHSQREYIAAQGPLDITVEDFWRMIWEQKVAIVVMLTKVKEKGKVKCEQYWQDENGTLEAGNLVVECVSYSNLNTYELREFVISNVYDTTMRKIKHFQFLMWPDFGVSNCDDLLNFLQDVRSHVRPNMTGPLLIHCSAGVGRSGTFIAVDQIREAMYDPSGDPDPSIDIFGLVLTMRGHRPRMVQTEAQYIFIHDCVCEVVRRKMLDDCPDDEHVYYNQGFQAE